MTTRAIVCVLGMHRSGTSLVAGVLHFLGVDLGPDGCLLPPAADNPKGFWEHQELMGLNDEILACLGGKHDDPPVFPPGWATAPELDDLRCRARAVIWRDFGDAAVWGWKDPRTCLTLPFWQGLLPQMHYVLCFRNPTEVVWSLQRRGNLSLEKAIHLWLTYVRSSLEHTESQPRCLVFYEEILEHWQRESSRLAGFLGMPERAEQSAVRQAIQSFIDKDLRHHHSQLTVEPTEGGFTPAAQALGLAQQVYARLHQEKVVPSRALEPALQTALDLVGPEIRRQKQQEKVDWQRRLERTKEELMALMPEEEMFILVDEEQLRPEVKAGRLALPFLERNGEYWGRPADDATAIQEVERLRETGARFLVVVWPAFWWLDYYSGLHRYLRATFACVLENERLVVFDLRGPERHREEAAGCAVRGPGSTPVAACCQQQTSDQGEPSIVRGLAVSAPADPVDGSIPPGTPEEEATSGAEHYLVTLAAIHETLCPELYLEIGVREGASLRLARRAAIGVDPNTALVGRNLTAVLYHETSDAFFERDAERALGKPIDLALIDGLHLFEYALRDFSNLERRASRSGLIVVDDIFPNNAVQGSRFRRTRTWAGDVWRLLLCLVEQRPDLVLLPLDCAPTGLLLVAGLDPTNRTLWDQYNPIIRRYLAEFTDVPPVLCNRTGALAPGVPLVGELLDGLRRLDEEGADARAVRSFCDQFGSRFRYRPEF